jgi:hypothetical protein
MAGDVSFAYTWRWPQLDETFVDADRAEKRDRELEQYLYAPPQQYSVDILLSTGAAATGIAPTVAYWERQRGQFVAVRCDWLATASHSGSDLLVLPLPGSAVPATVDLGAGIGLAPFPPSGVAIHNISPGAGGGIGNVYHPFFVSVGGLLGAAFLDGFTGVTLTDSLNAGDLISAVVCYRERT